MKNIPQTFKQNLKLNFASLPGKKLTKSHIKLLVKQVKQKMNEEKEKGIIWPTN